MRYWRGLAVGLGASLMAGCGFSTGFTPGVAADTPPDASVVVALTEARLALEPDAQGVFWSRSSGVLRALRDQPGLVGYSVRFEPWESRVRTMTVWRDEASLISFLSGRAHARAATEGMVALTESRFLRVHTTRAQAPLPWPEAATRLASEGREYYE